MKNNLARTEAMLDRIEELIAQQDGEKLSIPCVLADIAVSLAVIADALTTKGEIKEYDN